MSVSIATRSAEIRAELDFPVVDGDGHWIEIGPVFEDFVREFAGPEMAQRLFASPYFSAIQAVGLGDWLQGTLDERQDTWSSKSLWWSFPARNTRDRATALLPGLIADRLDEMGVDVSILYPTLGLHLFPIDDDEVRAVACRAFNAFAMEQISPYADRLIPVGVIPMCSPEEALAELDYAVHTLGYRALVFQHFATRPIPEMSRDRPEFASLLQRPDWFGIDSAYDYDPVWAKCVELGVAATFHGIGNGNGNSVRGSVSNQVFNRVGGLAQLNHRLASALFLGGVTRRFPTLNLAFLEGGVAWACTLFADLVGIWSKRNIDALPHLDPANLDRALLFSLIEQYGDGRTCARLDDIRAYYGQELTRPPAEEVDEFTALAIEAPEDLAELFTARLYFGCEGDDPMNALAFHAEMLPFGATLKAFYGSDISHWDVPNMSEVLEEAYEPVEAAALSIEQFRELVFENPVRLHGRMNPNFFAGTRVEAEAAKLLASPDPVP